LILKCKSMENIGEIIVLWERPTPSEPANLFYDNGEVVVYWTGVTTELFISRDAIVSDAYGDDYDEKSFDDYLATGGADEYSGYYADYYYAEVESGEIVSLATSYGP